MFAPNHSFTIGNLASETSYEIVVYSIVRTPRGNVESRRITRHVETRGNAQTGSNTGGKFTFLIVNS